MTHFISSLSDTDCSLCNIAMCVFLPAVNDGIAKVLSERMETMGVVVPVYRVINNTV